MVSKPPLPSLAPHSATAGLVKSLDSVDVLALRKSGFDDLVRAKVRVKDGDFAGREFITAQPKTEEAYSSSDFSPEEIRRMRELDEERDRSLSPLAAVVAEVESGRVHPVERIQLVEPEPYNRFKPFLRRK